MELGKAFTYIFQDKRWFGKLIIGWLVSIVPILNFAFTGYVTHTIRNVEADQPEPLPEWDDFGQKFVLGFYLWVAGLIYALPILILAFIFIVPVIVASSGNTSDTIGSIIAGTGVLVGCIVFIYALALSFLMPALNINLARKSSFGSMFQFSEFFRIVRQNSGDYIVAWLMTIVWSIVIGLVGGLLVTVLLIIPCLGWIAGFILGGLMGVIVPVVYAHLFGQVAAKDKLLTA